MKRVIVKKENGVLLKPMIVDRTTRRFYPYITENENGFADALDLKSLAKNKIETIESIFRTIDSIIKNYFLIEHYGYDFINQLFDKVKLAQSKEDLTAISKSFIGELNRIINKTGQRNTIKLENARSLQDKYNKNLKENEDLTLAILIKRITYIYLRNKIHSLNAIMKENLKLLWDNRETPEIMLGFLKENWNHSQDSNGVYSLVGSVLEQVLENEFAESKKHLCWQNCANARANLCPRIADIKAKRIDQYDIITDGYQTFDDKGKMIDFYVTGCRLYRKQVRKELTPEQKKRLSEAKASIKMYHYGAASLEEADQIERREDAKKLQLQLKAKK